MKLDASRTIRTRHATVTIEDQPLEIREVDLKPMGDAIAANVRAAVEAQPGSKWDRTGTLKHGITATKAGVFAPEGRLQRAEVAKKFVDEVLDAGQVRARNVDEALSRAVDKAIKVTK